MNTYIILAIIAIIIGFICKGRIIMKEMIKQDQGEYEIKIRKKKEEEKQNENQTTKTAAEILNQKYKKDQERTAPIRAREKKKQR